MITPIRDFVVVNKEEAPSKTASGLIHVPATASDEKVVSGVVVAVGSGLIAGDGSIIPLEVKVGDKIAFNKSLSIEVKDDGKTFLLLREEHILCIFK